MTKKTMRSVLQGVRSFLFSQASRHQGIVKFITSHNFKYDDKNIRRLERRHMVLAQHYYDHIAAVSQAIRELEKRS